MGAVSVETGIDESLLGRLTAAAARVRAVLESVPTAECCPGYEEFPRGWCGHASALLCTYLNDLDIGGIQFVYVGENRHAWVEGGSVIIDITADQFDDQLPPVWITTNRTWHARFAEEYRFRNDVRLWPDIFGWLPRLYNQITGDKLPSPAV